MIDLWKVNEYPDEFIVQILSHLIILVRHLSFEKFLKRRRKTKIFYYIIFPVNNLMKLH